MEINDALSALEADKKARVATAVEKVAEIMEKYNCRLATSITVSEDGRLTANIGVVPN
jgi:hypothetical protein